MTRPEDKDIHKEPQNEKRYAQLRRRSFFTKKDAFESALEGIMLSDAERERMLKAMDFAYQAGNEKATCIWIDNDLDSSKRVAGFYENVLKKVQGPNYNPAPNQIPESD